MSRKDKIMAALAVFTPLLAAVVLARGAGRDALGLPVTRLPPTVDPVRDRELWFPPDPDAPSEADQLFARWIRDAKSGAPALTYVDTAPRPMARKLTSYERWALGPYFYVDDLTVPVLHNGIRPDYLGEDLDPRVIALTDANGVFFPHEPQSFLSRWWLGALAHELYHAGQQRIGMTPKESTAASDRWGYVDSPVEVSARWKQREVLDGLAARARAFYAAA